MSGTGAGRTIRTAMVALASGTVLARATSFVASIVLARNLTLGGFGDYATALQVGLLLALIGHGGVQAVAARAIAQSPRDGGAWIRAAIRARLLLALGLYAVYALAVVPFVPLDRGVMLVAGALVVPQSFDLKGLADAAGRTRTEVFLEAVAGFSQLAFVVALALLDRITPLTITAAYLAARCTYATGVVMSLRTFEDSGVRPSLRRLIFVQGGHLTLAFAADRLTLASDAILIRALAGAEAAGLYAAADRISQAAAMPLSLAGRAMSPFLMRSVEGGDARRATETAVRTSAYAVLPLAAGGWIVAEALLARLFGDAYAAAGWTLRWSLLACVVGGIGWRFADVLFAHRREREYVTPLVLSVVVNWCASLLLIPQFGSAGSTLGTAAAQCVAVPLSCFFLKRVLDFSVAAPLARPAVVAVAVAGAAWAVPASWGALAAVAAGGATFAVAMWALELRRGWSALGTGIESAGRGPQA